MESICSCTVSHNLCQDIGISLFGMLKLFQNNHTCTLAHNKTASVFIKRNGCTQRILTCAQCSKACKACDTDRADSSLCTTGKHYICITILNGTESISDTMCSCRTCRYHVGAFSFSPVAIETFPAAIFVIIFGTRSGSTLEGPFSISFFSLVSVA